MTKAAEQLFVSRPGVSRVLRDLEDEVGATLFIRTNSGIIITEQGNALKQFIESYSVSYNSFLDRIREVGTSDGLSVLKIGVSPTSIRWFFPNFYYPLKRLHGELKLLVSELPTQDLFDAAANGDIDFSIAPNMSDNAYSLSAIRLYESDIVFCASNSSKYAGMKEIVYKDIENLPMVLPNIGDSTLPNPVMFITQSDVLRTVVAGGEIYSVLPRGVAEDWEGVCLIPIAPPILFTVSLYWSEAFPHKSSSHTLLDFVNNTFCGGM
jgi:DNA-binding transcriptional LysR family regulator